MIPGATDFPRPLRADAARNRARIVAAAREAFAEMGIDVGVEEIARRAGVGMGTLYRRFPTKESLVLAIFEEHVDALASYAAEVASLQPLSALEAYMLRACQEMDADRGLMHLLADHGRADVELRLGLDGLRRRSGEILEPLVTRAREAGVVRADLSTGDVAVLLRMLAVAIPTEPQPGDHDRAHFLSLLLGGLRHQDARASHARGRQEW